MPDHDDDDDEEFTPVASPPPTVDIRFGLAFLLFVAAMAFFSGYMMGNTNGRSAVYDEKWQEDKEERERKAISEIREEIRDLRREVQIGQ